MRICEIKSVKEISILILVIIIQYSIEIEYSESNRFLILKYFFEESNVNKINKIEPLWIRHSVDFAI